MGRHMSTETPPSLEMLLSASARGNRAAFQALYEATSGRLFGGAMRLLRDHALAQDALQDGYLKIWRNAASFDNSKGSALAWMGIIVRRAALDRLRQRVSHEPLDDLEIAAPVLEPNDPGVERCLKAIPQQQRNSLILSYVYGYTSLEISDRMGKPEGTIKSWVRRAGIALRECLEA
jgi:RNA polymerase sigma-70 factor, ECF subfamily